VKYAIKYVKRKAITLNKKTLAVITTIILAMSATGTYAYSNIYSINDADVQVSNSTVTINNSTVIFGENNTFPNLPDDVQSESTSTPTASSEPSKPTPSPTSQIKTSANLIVNCTLKLYWGDSGTPRLKVLGSIINTGTETAFNVTIHVLTWFFNGTEAISIDYKLSINDGHIAPSYPVNIAGNETYKSGTLCGMRAFSIPNEIWKTWQVGYVNNDCVSTYQVTASWDT
jgi:hypothetical protein